MKFNDETKLILEIFEQFIEAMKGYIFMLQQMIIFSIMSFDNLFYILHKLREQRKSLSSNFFFSHQVSIYVF